MPDANVDGVYDLPPVADLGAGRTIHLLKITGYSGATVGFVNSNIGADAVRKAFLRDATLNNGGEPFGIATNDLGLLKLRQGRTTYKYDTDWLTTPDDLTVRLV